MSERSCVASLKLIVDNTKTAEPGERLLAKAVQAYWRARDAGSPTTREHALKFLVPLPTGTPQGLAQKAGILANMVETRGSAADIAAVAAGIARDALALSRAYLNLAV